MLQGTAMLCSCGMGQAEEVLLVLLFACATHLRGAWAFAAFTGLVLNGFACSESGTLYF